MAIDVTLAAWLTNMVIDLATTPDEFQIPVTDIGVTDGTGEDDIREFVYSLLDTLYDAQEALAAADKPEGMKISKTTKMQDGSDNVLRHSFSVVVSRDIDTTDAIVEV